MLTPIDASSGRDYIVKIVTILISNEQMWEFRYSWGNRKLIIGSKNDLKFAYGKYIKKKL